VDPCRRERLSGGMDRKAEEEFIAELWAMTTTQRGPARLPVPLHGSRAAGWMIYGTCPGARGRPGGRDQPRGIRLGRHGQGPFTRYGKE